MEGRRRWCRGPAVARRGAAHSRPSQHLSPADLGCIAAGEHPVSHSVSLNIKDVCTCVTRGAQKIINFDAFSFSSVFLSYVIRMLRVSYDKLSSNFFPNLHIVFLTVDYDFKKLQVFKKKNQVLK